MTSVARILKSVVLPAPFSPSSPKNSPGRTSHDTLANARTDSRGLPVSTARQPRCFVNDFVSPDNTTALPLDVGGAVNAIAPAVAIAGACPITARDEERRP